MTHEAVVRRGRAAVLDHFRWIDGAADTWAMMRSGAALSSIVAALAALIEDERPDAVVGVESRGFVLAPAVAVHLGVGFVPVRKDGALFPGPLLELQTDTDYRGARRTLAIRRDLLATGQRVVLVDDWVETGSQAMAAQQLILQSGAELAAVAVVVDEAGPAARRHCPRSGRWSVLRSWGGRTERPRAHAAEDPRTLATVEEWWDVVDADGAPTGTTFRRGDEGWPAGSFHLVVTVCVFRSDRTVLMTQRAPAKEFAHGWEFPGGSAVAGESGAEAARRELREETGVLVEPEDLRWVGRFRERSALVDLAVVREPDGAIVEIDPAEVMASAWVPLPHVRAMRRSGVMAPPWGPRLDALWASASAAIESATISTRTPQRP